jgi:hypothetical protein
MSHAERTARVVGIAAEHANCDLRSFYHAIAALALFLHPAAVHGPHLPGGLDPCTPRPFFALVAADLGHPRGIAARA